VSQLTFAYVSVLPSSRKYYKPGKICYMCVLTYAQCVGLAVAGKLPDGMFVWDSEFGWLRSSPLLNAIYR